MPETPDLSFAIGLEPAKAVDYFKSKGYQITFRWDDIQRDAHARAFTAAGVMRTDILEAIRAEVDKGIRDGTPMDQFVRNLAPRLKTMGFWGEQEITDPETGEVRTINVTPWRLRNMYRINMQVALSRGRYLEHMANAEFAPFWVYKSLMDGRERRSHGDMNNSVFRYDDPIWNWLYPPNDWGCRCWTESTDERGLARRGLKVLNGSKIKQFSGDAWSHNPAAMPEAGLIARPADQPFVDDMDTAAMLSENPDNLPTLTPRRMADLILPGHTESGWSEEQYADIFLGEFGASVGNPVGFTDVVNETLMVSEGLFKDRAGQWKIFTQGREQYLLLLADTLRDPQEIRIGWTDVDGKKNLRRRYITLYDIPNSRNRAGLVIFEIAGGQWSGVTTFAPPGETYINKQRAEYKNLLYNKKGSP